MNTITRLLTALAVIATVAAVGCNGTKPAEVKAPAEAKAPETPETPETPEVAKTPEKPEAPKEHPSSSPAADMPSSGHFGAAFAMTEAPQPLKAIMDKSGDFSGKTVKVSGKVQSVCKKKGCWLVLQTDEAIARDVRITFKDYGFFAPKDCAGKEAIVEGVFSRTLVKEATRKHLAEDGGKDPSKVEGDAEEYRLVATGLEIKGS